MIYAILAWNVILTAFVAWLFISSRKLKSNAMQIFSSLGNSVAMLEDAVRKLCDVCKSQNELSRANADKLEKLRKEFDDVIADDLKTRADSERLFTEGLRGILDYGQQIPSLNKEAIRHE